MKLQNANVRLLCFVRRAKKMQSGHLKLQLIAHKK